MLWESEPFASASTAFSNFPKLLRKTCFLFLLENTVTKKRKQALISFDRRNIHSLYSRHNYVNRSF